MTRFMSWHVRPRYLTAAMCPRNQRRTLSGKDLWLALLVMHLAGRVGVAPAQQGATVCGTISWLWVHKALLKRGWWLIITECSVLQYYKWWRCNYPNRMCAEVLDIDCKSTKQTAWIQQPLWLALEQTWWMSCCGSSGSLENYTW